MKLTLINATQTGDIIPPLGLISLAVHLVVKKIMRPVDIQILDVNFQDPFKEIEQFRPDLVGISAMTISYFDAIHLAQKIKNKFKIPLIIGGIHISTAPWSLSKIFDLGIVGEGEETFEDVAKHFKEYKNFKDFSKIKKIPGLVFWHDDQIIQTTQRPLIEPLDNLAPLDWNFLSDFYFHPRPIIINNDFYFLPIGHLLTSRGCPYKCAFCSTSAFWSKVRFFSIQRVVEEIDNLYRHYQVRVFQVWDDLFAVSKERIKQITEALKKRGLLGKIWLNIQARANLIDDEMCALLKKLGVFCVGLGLESGSDRILGYLKKNSVSVEQNKNAILTLNKHQIAIVGSFMFGAPDENLEDLQKTLDFMNWMATIPMVTKIWYGLTIPYPNTELWQIALREGSVSAGTKMDWRKLDLLHTRFSAACPYQFFSSKISRLDFVKAWREADRIVKLIEQRVKDKNPKVWAIFEKQNLNLVLNRFQHFTLKQKLQKIIYKPTKAITVLKNIFFNFLNRNFNNL